MRARTVPTEWPLVALALALTGFGTLMVYSAGQTDVPSFVEGLWRTQLVWAMLGISVAYVTTRTSVRFLEWASLPVYLGATALLVLLIFIGQGAGTAASTKSWLAIGGVRLGQPSELAKVAVVLMMARVLSAQREAAKGLFDLWRPALVAFVPWLLVMAQPDLGTGLVFIGIFFAMLFWSGVQWPLLVMAASPGISLVLAFGPGVWGAWFLLFLALLAWKRPTWLESSALVLANVAMGVVAPILWDKLNPYQQRRLLVFLDPSSDPRNSGYHLIQSQVAIGSGGFLGKGLTDGSQKRLAFLPEQETDFIFSVVGEELGFVGVALALGLFCVLLLRTTRIAARSGSPFASLAAFGLTAVFFTHILVNVGMTIGLMPITGIPLPFFSYGGSFMLSCWLAIGILALVSAEGRGKADGLVI
ncbi:rod shape-determining protein RodA [Pseudogemmatithrix spongiicola]|uniref:Rod shape-determining protein RodA n=1 Tax=Pseudogemmatithrix spongiicola TaxID=3062599 RepID=A0AA49JUN6_9BACT|nr:rod shape-determining protein RodA [Gemmatimonadaceae bacterium 'strain 138']WKW15259.1 rod shape-determining protein RodA [Gemmatimonadaceae bacterium 'strain 318']